MAAFCVSCGNPLADGARFCTKCGATQPAAVRRPPGECPAPPLPSKGSSTGMKILIGVLVFFMFLILVVAGSCVYIGYRVKQKAHEFSKSMGGDAAPYTGKKQPCAMLSTSEASSAIGQPVASVEQRGTMRVSTPSVRPASTSTSNTRGKTVESLWDRPRSDEARCGNGYL